MSKKLLYVAAASLLIFIAAFAVFLFKTQSTIEVPKTEYLNDYVTNVPATTSPSVECKNTEEISYMYYTGADPVWKQNNIFGLYVYAENASFFELAQNLVNSNGGEWGYVLIPFNVADNDKSKWGRVFTQLKNKKLIPVIQLHAVDPDKYKTQTKEAAKFLNEFVWPIRYRYVSVYNEPNDSKFWYGRVDPKEYAEILDYTIDTFKELSGDFYMLNGALNVSAPSVETYMDAFDYMAKMDEAVPGIFSKLDGWASHSYPQPEFSGNPRAYGRYSIRAYETELAYLKNTLGVTKSLPVFITETGWAHSEGESYEPKFYGVDKISEFFKIAFEEVWLKDERVRAVMPFTIWYEPPFDHFAWVNSDRVPYKHFDAVKKLSKIKGEPPVLKTEILELSKCEQ